MKTSKLQNQVPLEMDSLDIPPGQVRRRIGDVFLFSRDKYVIESVSASRAVARCLARQKHMITDGMTGTKVEAETTPTYISISNCCDRADVIDHILGYQAPVAVVKPT